MTPIKELFKKSWEIFKSNYKEFLFASAALSVVMLLFVMALPANEAQSETMQWSLGAFVLLILVIIGSLWTELALLYLALNPTQTAKDAFAETVGKMASLLWIAVLTFLSMLGGFVLLIIPGIIFAIWFSFTADVLVAEGVKGTSALKRSKELVKGHTAEVFARWFVLGLIYIAASLVIGLIFENKSNSYDVANAIVSFVLTPFAAVYSIQMYKNLKELKEAPVDSVPPVEMPLPPNPVQ